MKTLQKYDFHDSLLEGIFCNEQDKTVELELDLCKWRQTWYNENDNETERVHLIFNEVSSSVIPDFTPSGDEIIDFDLINNNGVKITVFNDIKNSCYTIIIYADKFTLKKNK